MPAVTNCQTETVAAFCMCIHHKIEASILRADSFHSSSIASHVNFSSSSFRFGVEDASRHCIKVVAVAEQITSHSHADEIKVCRVAVLSRQAVSVLDQTAKKLPVADKKHKES